MSAPKFTPWSIEGERLVTSNLVVITQREDDGMDYPIAYACKDAAPLVRAAPELYEALERFCVAYERDTALRPAAMANACNLARAALTKAVRP